MSSDNRLNKPSFSKGVRGYDTEEVDAYVTYVNERFGALTRENAELKRKLTKFMLGLDRPEGETDKNAVTLPGAAEINGLLRALDDCASRSREIEKAISGAISLAEELKLEEAVAREADRVAPKPQPEPEKAPEKAPQPEPAEEPEKTPADDLASLDFYTDGKHADGTDYDPMTLAQQVTERKKPSFADLMHPLDDGKGL